MLVLISGNLEPRFSAGTVPKFHYAFHIDPIQTILCRLVLLCLRTLGKVGIFKLDHWLGLGDQKRGKPLSKISLFGILKVFFHMVLCKNGHNATTNGRISTIDGSIHISCSRTIQKSANTRFKVNPRGENVR